MEFDIHRSSISKHNLFSGLQVARRINSSIVKSELPLSVYRERSESRTSLKRILFIWSLFALAVVYCTKPGPLFHLMKLFGDLMNIKQFLSHLLQV